MTSGGECARPMWVPAIQQLLEHNLRQGQVNQELAQGLQNLCLAPAAAVPIPNSSHESLHLLTKLGADDGMEMFLATFERVAQREQRPTGSWSRGLASLLIGEAQRAYYAISETEAANFTQLRQKILDRCATCVGA